MDDLRVSNRGGNKRSHMDLNEVELRRSIEDHIEKQRLRAEFGDVIDM